MLLYVDDMLIASKRTHLVKELKKHLIREFDMKHLGPTKKILGMEVHRDKSK